VGSVESTEQRDGETWLLLRYASGVLHVPTSELHTLRPLVSAAEARRRLTVLLQAMPYVGPSRRGDASRAFEGTVDQRLAAIGTFLEWWSEVPPAPERVAALRADPDWAFALRFLMNASNTTLAELDHVLGMKLTNDDRLDRFCSLRQSMPSTRRIPPPDSP